MQKDFATSVFRNYPTHSPRDVWNAVLSRVVERVLEIVAEVEDRGVYINAHTTLSDLPSLCKKYEVVTLLTHWRPGWLFHDQILDLRAIQEELFGSTKPIAQFLRERLNSRIAKALPSNPDTTISVNTFCEIGNALLKSADLGPSECPREWHLSSDEVYRAHANRSVIDTFFSSALVPGNRVELADGMKASTDLTLGIPENFEGVLDLTICNSVMVAEEVKRVRHCTCLANEYAIDLALRAEIYAGAISVISETPYEYADAMRDVRISVIEQLGR